MSELNLGPPAPSAASHAAAYVWDVVQEEAGAHAMHASSPSSLGVLPAAVFALGTTRLVEPLLRHLCKDGREEEAGRFVGWAGPCCVCRLSCVLVA